MCVVTVECLAALDHLFWLRTGARAADVLGCNQSTISRHARVCQDLFGVTSIKHAAEWCVQGDDALLNAERRVHQAYRWSRNLPLRLDAQHWLAVHCEDLDLPRWSQGNLNYLGYEQPLALIKNCILDAWLCSSPDHPRDPELCALPLCTMPAYLVVKQGHPLLPLPAHAFPTFEAMLSSRGLGGAHVHSSDDAGVGQSAPAAVEDLLVGIASPLTLHLSTADPSA